MDIIEKVEWIECKNKEGSHSCELVYDNGKKEKEIENVPTIQIPAKTLIIRNKTMLDTIVDTDCKIHADNSIYCSPKEEIEYIPKDSFNIPRRNLTDLCALSTKKLLENLTRIVFESDHEGLLEEIALINLGKDSIYQFCEELFPKQVGQIREIFDLLKKMQGVK